MYTFFENVTCPKLFFEKKFRCNISAFSILIGETKKNALVFLKMQMSKQQKYYIIIIKSNNYDAYKRTI